MPLNECQTMLDLAWEMRMPVLLVGHSGLGTINHVLLSLEAIRRRGCNLLGVILNDIAPVSAADSYIHDDNVRAIESFGKVRVVTRIPYLGAATGHGPVGLQPPQLRFSERVSAMNYDEMRRRDIEFLWHPYTEITSFEQSSFPIVESCRRDAGSMRSTDEFCWMASRHGGA